ncbi:MAG: hypothetical protein LBI99_09985 [Propionibacteriaceae bacterium]|jgi:hypothetical protein|nr:hypothetical protein [Propionibacteriaceae bacterium]
MSLVAGVARQVGLAVFVGCFALGGCVASPETGPVTSPGAGQVSEVDPSGVVDPQILSDAIDGALFVPGESMIRAMRVLRAGASIRAVDCGGEPFENLDYTGDRFDQAVFPYLKLIADKGLVEHGEKPKGVRNGSGDECLLRSLPSFEDWMKLDFAWEDIVREEYHSNDLAQVLKRQAICLREKSGLKVDDDEPAARYMNSVDFAASSLDTDDHKEVEAFIDRHSDIYVECTSEYETVFRERLLELRPAFIEKNRELLTKFALELSDAGYVP